MSTKQQPCDSAYEVLKGIHEVEGHTCAYFRESVSARESHVIVYGGYRERTNERSWQRIALRDHIAILLY
jgi:hypothetical protein